MTTETTAVTIETVNPEIICASIERVESTIGRETAVALRDSFAPHFEQAVALVTQAATITNPADPTQQKLARTVRLGLKRIRCDVENQRKTMKEDSLRRGKAIDGYANIIKELCEPTENKLLAVEQHAERMEAARIAALVSERTAALVALEADPTAYNLVVMDDATFALVLSGAKKTREDRIEAARRAEAERVAREQADRIAREKAEADAAAARAEAEKERKAREAAEAKAEKERKAAAEKARKEREAIEAKARAEREKAEAAARKAQAEADAKLRTEREARERAEQEAAAARRKEQARAAEEARAKQEAADRAARAPDKEKLVSFANAIDELPLPPVDSAEAKDILVTFVNALNTLTHGLRRKTEGL